MGARLRCGYCMNQGREEPLACACPSLGPAQLDPIALGQPGAADWLGGLVVVQATGLNQPGGSSKG